MTGRTLALVGAVTIACSVRAAPAPDGSPSSERASGDRVGLEAPAEPELATSTPAWIGVVVAYEAVDLATTLEGTLGAIDAELGDWVEPRTLLVSVEAPIIEAELEGARAALRSAEAELAERELLIVEARRAQMRERALSHAGASADEQREQAELSVEKAVIAARRAAALVDERRAEVVRLRARLEGGQLHAPFRGRIVRWYRSAGEIVQAGERVVRIAAVDHLWVRFAVPVAELERVFEGQRLEVRLGPEGEPLYASVRHIAPELELASQMMLVEAELDRSSGEGTRAEAGQACYVNPKLTTEVSK